MSDRPGPALLLGVGLSAAGVAAGSTVLFLSAGVALAYGSYRAGATPPAPSVAVERTVAADRPGVGTPVEVTVSVTNEGDAAIPDARIVDGVPEMLPVVEGSPRLGTSLAPGETDSFAYTVETQRGRHDWEPVTVAARDAAGSTTRSTTCEVENSLLACADARSIDLFARTVTAAGRVQSDSAGEGVEFHSVRRYRRGDSLSRVDWNSYTSTGDLRTVEYRRNRAASVVFLLDRTDAAAVAPDGDSLPATELGGYAVGQIGERLLAESNRVGAVTHDGRWMRYRSPSAGRAAEAELRRFLDEPGSGVRLGYWSVSHLQERVPAGSQFVVVSPLTDDGSIDRVRELRAYGFPVTVLSPDPTGGGVGGAVVRLERDRRLRDLRADGVRVVDWGSEQPLGVALERAVRRWSA